MTAGLELTLTSNIFQQHACISPSTLNDSLRLRAVLLVQFVDIAIYACLPLLTCSYTNLCNERTQRLCKTLDNIYDDTFEIKQYEQRVTGDRPTLLEECNVRPAL
jgi:hypothetical protein